MSGGSVDEANRLNPFINRFDLGEETAGETPLGQGSGS